MVVGSSKLAGMVGIFDMMRILGEFLLLRKQINTPFMYSNGSAYMHSDLASCEKSLQRISQMIENEGGLPAELCPFVIGIAGRGTVAKGAIELLQNNLPVEMIEPEMVKELVENPPEDRNQKIYLVVFGREHFVKKVGSDEKFQASDYEQHPDLYEPIFHTQYLPYLSILVSSINWTKGSHRLLTTSQIQHYAQTPNPKLLGICDISALLNGPIEFFKRECSIERPYFLYDTHTDTHYDTFEDLKHSTTSTNNHVIFYQGVEQLPAELPKDASEMFSSKLQHYIIELLQAAKAAQSVSFEEAYSQIPIEIKKGITTTSEGTCGEYYDYLNKLIQ